MTFSLFASAGEVKCSGVAYNYHGNIREKHYDSDLHDDTMLHAIVDTSDQCGRSQLSQRGFLDIKKGMTRTEARGLLGAPDDEFEHKGTVSLAYRRLRGIVFLKHGKVTRIQTNI